LQLATKNFQNQCNCNPVLFDAPQIPAGIALEFRVFSAFIKSYFEIHLHRIYWFPFLSSAIITRFGADPSPGEGLQYFQQR